MSKLFEEYIDNFYEKPCPACGEYCISYKQRSSATAIGLDTVTNCTKCGKELLIYYSTYTNIIRAVLYSAIFLLMTLSLAISDLYALLNISNFLIIANMGIRRLVYVPFSVVDISDEVKLRHYKKARYTRLGVFCVAILIIFIIYYNNVYLTLSKGFYI